MQLNDTGLQLIYSLSNYSPSASDKTMHSVRYKFTKCSHCKFRARLQGDRQSDLALQVELSQVEHLLSQDLLLFHPPDAVQSEAHSVVPQGLLFHPGKLECFREDRTRALLHARLGPLLLGGQQDQVDLPRDVARLFESRDVCCRSDRDSQPLLTRVIFKSDVQGAVFGEWLWLVGCGEARTGAVLKGGKNKRKAECKRGENLKQLPPSTSSINFLLFLDSIGSVKLLIMVG